jgi:tRNA-intron endonuclease
MAFKMQLTGKLVGNKIIISKPKEVGRLYNKSHFGKIVSNNKLELDFFESVFLLEENKIRIFHKKKVVSFSMLYKKASKKISRFELIYTVYSDIRRRGYAIKICKKSSVFDLYKENHIEFGHLLIKVFSEEDNFDINDTKEIVLNEIKDKNELWYAIVDDENDITYYHISYIKLKGENKDYKYEKGICYLFEKRLIMFDEKKSKKYFNNSFYGRLIGDALYISFIEALYLINEENIDILNLDEEKISKEEFENIVFKSRPHLKLKYMVYDDLKKRGLIVKTGFKFGSHFRIYSKHPNNTHAEYLVQIVLSSFNSIWSDVSKAVRLAHTVNKEIVFAIVESKKISYIALGRLRP